MPWSPRFGYIIRDFSFKIFRVLFLQFFLENCLPNYIFSLWFHTALCWFQHLWIVILCMREWVLNRKIHFGIYCYLKSNRGFLGETFRYEKNTEQVYYLRRFWLLRAEFRRCPYSTAILTPWGLWPVRLDGDSFCRYGTHCHERFPTGHAERFVYLANNSFSASWCEFGDIPCSKSRLVADRLAGRGSRLFVIPDAVSPFPEKEIEKAKAR